MKTNNLNNNIAELNSLVTELQMKYNDAISDNAELEQEVLACEAIIEDKERLIKELQAHIRELDTYEVRELEAHERRDYVS